jgi:hypothetical protein
LKLGVTTNADRIFKGGKMNGFRRKWGWWDRRLGGGGSGSMIVCSWDIRGLGEGLKKEK